MIRYVGFLCCCLGGLLDKAFHNESGASAWLAAATVIWCVNSEGNQKK